MSVPRYGPAGRVALHSAPAVEEGQADTVRPGLVRNVSPPSRRRHRCPWQVRVLPFSSVLPELGVFFAAPVQLREPGLCDLIPPE